MASCKDCVHVDVCEDITRHKLSPSRAEKILPILREYGKTCELFKDRSRFVELPIKPSEKVFYFDTEGRIYETTVTQLVYGASGFLIDSDVMFNSNLIGKRFFLTREEAEAALKERET
jgi:hypothetical protein